MPVSAHSSLQIGRGTPLPKSANNFRKYHIGARAKEGKKQHLVSYDVNNTELCVPGRMRWFPRKTVQAISASFALRRPAPRHLSSR